MDTDSVTKIVNAFVAGVPKNVVAMLREVDVLVCKDVEMAKLEIGEEFEGDVGADDVPADCKGIFIGEPMEEDEDDSGLTAMPEGVIFLIAGNIADEKEVSVVLLHEVGHALGMDEDEVAALGLGAALPEGKAADAPGADKPSGA